MTTPYTYLLKHLPTGKVYYGCRFAKNCDPSEFWVKYKTSSKYVKELIDQYGEDTFVFEIRKTFNDVKSCRLWETRVLKRMDVVNRDIFLNKTDNIIFKNIQEKRIFKMIFCTFFESFIISFVYFIPNKIKELFF